ERRAGGRVTRRNSIAAAVVCPAGPVDRPGAWWRPGRARARRPARSERLRSDLRARARTRRHRLGQPGRGVAEDDGRIAAEIELALPLDAEQPLDRGLVDLDLGLHREAGADRGDDARRAHSRGRLGVAL